MYSTRYQWLFDDHYKSFIDFEFSSNTYIPRSLFSEINFFNKTIHKISSRQIQVWCQDSSSKFLILIVEHFRWFKWTKMAFVFSWAWFLLRISYNCCIRNAFFLKEIITIPSFHDRASSSHPAKSISK